MDGPQFAIEIILIIMITDNRVTVNTKAPAVYPGATFSRVRWIINCVSRSECMMQFSPRHTDSGKPECLVAAEAAAGAAEASGRRISAAAAWEG